jgi:ActR/RegA family two-component response regulator
MSDARILVVDNDEQWRDVAGQLLSTLGDVEFAEEMGKAVELIRRNSFGLAVVDLSMLGDPLDPLQSDELGMELLVPLKRESPHCRVIVLTGYATVPRALAAWAHGAFWLIRKEGFGDGSELVEKARRALFEERLERAVKRHESTCRLTINFNETSLLGSELEAPERSASYDHDPPHPIDVTDLASRTDVLSFYVRHGLANFWRPAARSIGKELHTALTAAPHFLKGLSAAEAISTKQSDIRLVFSGPSTGLGVPFELMHDLDDYLCLKHQITRRVTRPGNMASLQPFHRFLEDLYKTGKPLRVLVVGSNSDGRIKAAESEATQLAAAIAENLRRLFGTEPEVVLLAGDRATHTEVSEALESRRFHLFHFAGHGTFDGAHPEASGLELRHATGTKQLTAAQLKVLAQDSELRFVFLSCCLSARNEANAGRGDFHGVLDALARAQVPIALGYRWKVSDRSALPFAQAFYGELWRTLSPGAAMLHARQKATGTRSGRDDATWASPVMFVHDT